MPKTTQLPWDIKEFTPEVVGMMNTFFKAMVYQQTTLNETLGDTEPEAKLKNAGMFAYADGTNWNPLSKGVPCFVFWNGTAWLDVTGSILTLTGNITGNRLISTVATGTAPLGITSTTVVTNLNADLLDGNHAAAFALESQRLGYSLSLGGAIFSPADASAYYIGQMFARTVGTNETQVRVYIPKTGTIKIAQLWWIATTGVDGTNETFSAYVRLNGTTDTLIQTIGNTDAGKIFAKYNLSISVAAGDFITLKLVTPIWATNPTDVLLSGNIYIE